MGVSSSSGSAWRLCAPAAEHPVERAQHLQIVIRDIKELEKRITRTSLEIQKYEKRLSE